MKTFPRLKVHERDNLACSYSEIDVGEHIQPTMSILVAARHVLELQRRRKGLHHHSYLSASTGSRLAARQDG